MNTTPETVTKEAELVRQFRAARRVSTPLLAVRTADPAETIDLLGANITKQSTPIVVQWDCVQGFHTDPGNQISIDTISELCKGKEPFTNSSRPTDALSRIRNMPRGGVLFMKNIHLFLSDPQVKQAIWNLRDIFMSNKRTLVLLGPDFRLGSELQNDVVILDEPLPNAEQIQSIIAEVYKDASIEMPEASSVGRMVKALAGLPAFPISQASAMALVQTGIDYDMLWNNKVKYIEQTPGLSVYSGKEGFDDIGGCENIKFFLNKYMTGQEPPNLIVFIDEIEKSMGNTNDTSGVSQGFQGTMLSEMEDNQANGAIFLGPPGAAKSAIAKAMGNEAKVATIEFDINGMKESLVGNSEANLRRALKTVWAMGQGRVFFVATCNGIKSLTPELRRRFKLGTFFFDLPNKEERLAIWKIYLDKYQHSVNLQTDLPNDDKWTGAEIKQCCYIAFIMNMTLHEAANFVVPVAVSASEQIEALRKEAHGSFISASYPGYYRYEGTDLNQRLTAKAAEVMPMEGRRAIGEFLEGDD